MQLSFPWPNRAGGSGPKHQLFGRSFDDLSYSVGVPGEVRLAELLATVSLASDLAHDVPPESALRDALFSVRLARLAGWSRDDLSDTYYLALLYHVGCTGAVSIQSRMGAGDDVSVRRWLSEVDFANRPELMRMVVTRVAREWTPGQWASGVAGMISEGGSAPEAFANVADVAVRLSARLGASPRVSEALRHTYARWDGKVFPGLPRGTSSRPSRGSSTWSMSQ
jgi:hypothetical protein